MVMNVPWYWFLYAIIGLLIGAVYFVNSNLAEKIYLFRKKRGWSVADFAYHIFIILYALIVGVPALQVRCIPYLVRYFGQIDPQYLNIIVAWAAGMPPFYTFFLEMMLLLLPDCLHKYLKKYLGNELIKVVLYLIIGIFVLSNTVARVTSSEMRTYFNDVQRCFSSEDGSDLRNRWEAIKNMDDYHNFYKEVQKKAKDKKIVLPAPGPLMLLDDLNN